MMEQQSGAKSENSDQGTSITVNEDDSHQALASRFELKGKTLGKDELREYINDPFWVKLRNVMFTSFWVIWFAAIFLAVGYALAHPSCPKRS